MFEGEITLGSIATQVSELASQNARDHEEMKKRVEGGFKSMNGRVRTLEKWMWGIGCTVGFIGFCITIFVALKR